MPVTIVKEDGTGLTNANSYASVADGETYANERLKNAAWSNATDDDKARALIMATRQIDNGMQFNGYKNSQSQALQWPRRLCPDPDSDQLSIILGGGDTAGPYLPENVVPPLILQATCEQAVMNLRGDRTGDSQSAGVDKIEIVGAVKIDFSDASTQPLPLSRDVLFMLEKYGNAMGDGGGVVKLQRA